MGLLLIWDTTPKWNHYFLSAWLLLPFLWSISVVTSSCAHEITSGLAFFVIACSVEIDNRNCWCCFVFSHPSRIFPFIFLSLSMSHQSQPTATVLLRSVCLWPGMCVCVCVRLASQWGQLCPFHVWQARAYSAESGHRPSHWKSPTTSCKC